MGYTPELEDRESESRAAELRLRGEALAMNVMGFVRPANEDWVRLKLFAAAEAEMIGAKRG